MTYILKNSWQKINETRHFCHSWQDLNQRRLTAMAIILFLIVLTLVGYAGITGIGAADSRDPEWSLFPLNDRPAPPRVT